MQAQVVPSALLLLLCFLLLMMIMVSQALLLVLLVSRLPFPRLQREETRFRPAFVYHHHQEEMRLLLSPSLLVSLVHHLV